VALGSTYTYGDLLKAAGQYAIKLEEKFAGGAKQPVSDLTGPRVGVMAGPTAEYTVGMFAAWLSGGVAVPLCLSNPPIELEYNITHSSMTAVLASEQYLALLAPLCEKTGTTLIKIEKVASGRKRLRVEEGSSDNYTLTEDAGVGAAEVDLSKMKPEMGALIIYTSGTTGRPKGALHTHAGLGAQCRSLSEAWRWSSDDRIFHALPLHHIHGIVNAWLCCVFNGATVEFYPKFSPSALWKRGQEEPPLTIFMGVPTMYSFLISAYDKMSEPEQAAAVAGIRKLRLMISGSAACPVPIMNRWQELTGQTLLERYGMTEIGMGLSNPYEMGGRRPGCVGAPLPSQQLTVVPAADAGKEATPQDGPGEARIKGPCVFKEYFGNPEATAAAFDEEGYFRTGNIVQRVDGAWKILGRNSVDIIKHGGYKLSALEIENHLLLHPDIGEVAVCGVEDPHYGELVGAVVVLKAGASLELEALRTWSSDQMADYKIPKRLVVLEAMPRNAMGKVNKKELVKVFNK